MERIRGVFSIPRMRKLLSFLFYLLLIIIIILGIDLAATVTGLVATPPNDLVTEARWGLDTTGENIEFNIGLDLPNWGFLSKGAVLQIQLTVPEEDPIYDKVTMELGEKKEILMSFELTTEIENQLTNAGSLQFDLLIQIKPMFMGNVMESATRYVTYQGRIT